MTNIKGQVVALRARPEITLRILKDFARNSA
jgi:hypothetical protein